MIDLHLHTTASDGTLSPEALVARADEARLTVISVTDHDTTAATHAAGAAARTRGLTLVSGIEITAVEAHRDVHVLGYYIDPDNRQLAEFLDTQRADRVRRIRDMADRLAALGVPVEVESLLGRAAAPGRSIGRPALADALVAGGHARDRDDAFERFLGHGRPAFVPRRGAPAADVIAIIHTAGGIASLAHPGLVRVDALIPALAAAGLDALEARHTDHAADVELHYRGLARRLGLAVSGGSDFHGGAPEGTARLGAVTLPAEDFAGLQQRAGARA